MNFGIFLLNKMMLETGLLFNELNFLKLDTPHTFFKSKWILAKILCFTFI